MSAVLSVVKDTKFKSVEIAQRVENRDAWELADAIYEDVIAAAPHVAQATGDTSNSGLYEAIGKVYDAHESAATEVAESQIRHMFSTVRTWPVEDRMPDKATFSVHAELRGKDYPNRRQIIEKLASRNKAGRATRTDIRRWKSERKPEAFKTFIQIAEERIRRAVHDAGKPWNMVAQDDRDQIVFIIRTIADEIENGDFA